MRRWLALLALLALAGCGRSQHAVGLGVPHIAQERLLCVPTSAAMVLAFYGDPQDPRRLKALSRGGDYAPGAPFDDFSITRFADMKAGLARLGYRWSDAAYPDTADGFTQGLRAIQAELDAGRPVLVDITHDGVGHTLVVSGYDAGRRQLTLVDPAQPAPGVVTLSYDQFTGFWNEHAYGGQFRALMTTARKG